MSNIPNPPKPSKTSIVEKQKAVAVKNMTVNSQIVLRGRKLSDNTVYVRTFSNYAVMEQWLTTFEADQYDFD